MELIKTELIKIWSNQIRERFESGYLIYEKQLQAELYYNLKQNLSRTYNIWVEPVIYLEESYINKSKPDLVITKNEEIIAIIELKFSPWGFPKYQGDIKKLEQFQKESNKKRNLWLSAIPKTPNWQEQEKIKELSRNFNMAENLLISFIVYGHPDSEALKPQYYLHLKRFLLLYGSITPTGLEFNHKYNH